MSYKLHKRPFFSVIIPCYNSDYRLGILLQSIVEQHCSDDIEVVISDDCSSKQYDDIIKPFENKLFIKRVKTDYNFSTNNTRQRGLENATGYWITFADHDDMFEPDVFIQVKNAIISTGEKYECVTDFRELDPINNSVIREHIYNRSWTHGNFYNLDNFIKKYNICYMKDLPSHEDIYFSCLTDCVLYELKNFKCLGLHIFTYRWYKHKDSTTMKRDKQRNFIEEKLNDYIIAVVYPHIREYKLGRIDATYCYKVMVGCLVHCYFYIQSFMYLYADSYIKKNLIYAGALYKLIKKEFKKDKYNIITLFENDEDGFESMRKDSLQSCGNFEISMSFTQFLDLIDDKTMVIKNTDKTERKVILM